MNQETIIGIVKNGKFILLPEKELAQEVLLTTIQMQASVPPESAQLDISQYEGNAIAVSGHNAGDTIYNASVIDAAGPLLTAVVKHALK